MPPGGLDQAREPEPSPSSSPRSPSFGSAHSRFYSSLVSPHLLCSTLSFPPSSSSSPSCLRLPTASGLPTRSADSSPTVCVLRAPGASLSPPSSPSAPASQVPHESLLPRSSFPLGQARDAAFDAFVPGGGLSWLQVRWKKKRGKKEKIILNAEQVATKTKYDERLGSRRESGFQIDASASPVFRLYERDSGASPLTLAVGSSRCRRFDWRTALPRSHPQVWRETFELKSLGLRQVGRQNACSRTEINTDDDEFTQANSRKRDSQASTSSSASSGGEFKQAAGVKESSMGRKQKRAFAGRTFVTPLTKLQHQAALPRSPLHARFDFPHTFHYDVFWGPPQVEEEPNKTACWVSFHVADLKLSDSQEQRLLDILGPERYDEQTGIACLEADVFPQLNHNAAYLGESDLPSAPISNSGVLPKREARRETHQIRTACHPHAEPSPRSCRLTVNVYPVSPARWRYSSTAYARGAKSVNRVTNDTGLAADTGTHTEMKIARTFAGKTWPTAYCVLPCTQQPADFLKTKTKMALVATSIHP
ncbi:3'-5' exoribonuclease CSL4, related [Neospora caninum Liverpool]|uniref:3'-5' exoribonuclease CSL4, related n=1 Tax=Neospora caninum (strain Liverpool) TaxID=572307 RepID=F0VF57_NEOCL|nr:3'-5' exoribonuclease CSL4, related [Neospora caninum Liverpool]CBZ52351.1 3'-5' exoribonuclease CSL4, related [Neospora caninum Liverpool]|eukprot:XP_003882383.1 3'-5' exoribonuclease CSL4, related [Neospora caninum Liverpool]